MIDVSQMIAMKSDQLNAADLIGGDITCTITGATAIAGEQPLALRLSGRPHPWKPCKTMRRLMAQVWGVDAMQWVGRAVRLTRDPTVTWAGAEVGGIRIAGMSHIPAGFTAQLQVAKGKYKACKIAKIAPPNQTGAQPEPETHPGQPGGESQPDPLAPVAESLGVELPRLEAALTAASGHPVRDRAKAAAWAAGKGAEALAAALAAT